MDLGIDSPTVRATSLPSFWQELLGAGVDLGFEDHQCGFCIDEAMDLGFEDHQCGFRIDEAMDFGIHDGSDIGSFSSCNVTPDVMDLEFETPKKKISSFNTAADGVMNLEFETAKKKPRAIESGDGISSASKRKRQMRREEFLPSLQPADLVMFLAFVTRILAIANGKFFLELCAGAGGFCNALNGIGWQSLGVDNECSSRLVCLLDITARWFEQQVLEWIGEGKLHGLGGGLPCNTCSRARRGRYRVEDGKLRKGFPVALRSACQPWGLDGLDAVDKSKLDDANKCFSVAFTLMRAAIVAGLAVWIENPRDSILWLMDQVLALRSLVEPCKFVEVVFSQCCFNSPWLKPTKLWLFNCAVRNQEDAIQQGFRRCSWKRLSTTKGSWCPHLQKQHLVLSGFSGGMANTKKAAEYNADMSLAMASLVRGRVIG